MQLLEKGGCLSAGRSRVAVTRPPGLRENHIDRSNTKKEGALLGRPLSLNE